MDLKINLTLILASELENPNILPDMPTEEDMMEIFYVSENQATPSSSSPVTPSSNVRVSEPDVAINEPCIVIWDVGTVTVRQWYHWYVGICLMERSQWSIWKGVTKLVCVGYTYTLNGRISSL